MKTPKLNIDYFLSIFFQRFTKNNSIQQYLSIIATLIIIQFNLQSKAQSYVCPGEKDRYKQTCKEGYIYASVTGGTAKEWANSPTDYGVTITWDATPTGSATISSSCGSSTNTRTINVRKILNPSLALRGSHTQLSENDLLTVTATLSHDNSYVNSNPTISWAVLDSENNFLTNINQQGTSISFRPSSYLNVLEDYYWTPKNPRTVRVRATYTVCGKSVSKTWSPITITPSHYVVPGPDLIYNDTTTCRSVANGDLTIDSVQLNGITYTNDLPGDGVNIVVSEAVNSTPIGTYPNTRIFTSLSDFNNLDLNLGAGVYFFTVERIINNLSSGVTDGDHNFTIVAGPEINLNLNTPQPNCNTSPLTVNATVVDVADNSELSGYNFFGASGTPSGNSFNYNLSSADSYSLYAQHSTVTGCTTIAVPFENPGKIQISKDSETSPTYCFAEDRITNTEYGTITAIATNVGSALAFSITRNGQAYSPGFTTSGNSITYTVPPGQYNITATDNCNIISNSLSSNITSLKRPTVLDSDIIPKNPDCPNEEGSITLSKFSYNGTDYNNGSNLDAFLFYNGISSTNFTEVANKHDFFNFTATPTSPTKYYFKIEYEGTRCPVEYDRDLFNRTKVALNTPTSKESCLDNNNGTISISSREGNAASTLREYTISPAHSSVNTIQISDGSAATFNELHPNVNYTITVNDFCTNGSNTASVGETIGNLNRPSANFSSTQIECHNQTNGTLTVTPINASGTTPSYNITLFPDDESYLGVPSGEQRIFEGLNHIDNYSVKIEDSNGCIETLENEVPEIVNPPQLEFVTVLTDLTHVTCWDGSDGLIPANATGGTGQINFSIDGGAFNPGTDNGFSYIYDFPGLSAGEYNITIQDEFECSIDTNNTITQPDEYTVSSPSTISTVCHGGSDGSLSVAATGGTPDGTDYVYNLLDESNNQLDSYIGATATFSGRSFGNYYVNVYDSRNCSLTSETVTLNQPEKLIISAYQSSASCFDDDDVTLRADVSGGSGTYTIIWKDLDKNILDNTNTDTIGVGKGTYYVDVVDSENCAYGRTAPNLNAILFRFDVDVPDTLKLKIDNQFDVDYNGLSNASVSLSSFGGWSFHQYSKDGTNFQNLPEFNGLEAKDYTFYVKDGSNCINTIETTITQPEPFLVNLGNLTNVNCFEGSDGQIVIDAKGGRPPYNFILDDGQGNIVTQESNIFQNLLAGNYTATIEYNTYSQTVNNIIIGQPLTSVSSSITDYQSPHCSLADGSATVSVSGGTSPYSYTWNNGQTSMSVNNLSSGNHFVQVTDDNGCIDTSLIMLYDLNGPQLAIAEINNLLCFDSENTGSATLAVSGGANPYNIQWNDPDQQTGLTASNLAAGDYSATVTDNEGCISILEGISLTKPEELIAILDDFKDPVCFNDANGEIVVSAAGGIPPYSYQWQNLPDAGNSNTISELTANKYYLHLTDANNCLAIDSFELKNPDEIIIDLADSVFICQGQIATLDAGNNGSLFQWSSDNGFDSDQQIVNVQEQGSYTVIVSNIQGCSNSKRIHLKYENKQLEGAFLLASEASMADTVVLIEISWPVPDSVEWTIPDDFMRLTDGEAYKKLIPLQTGEYTIGMKAYMAGCQDIVEKTISILPADNLKNENETVKDLIQEAKLFPNPNSGVFEVDVKLAYEAAIWADVFSMKGMRMMPTKYDYGKKEYLLGFNLIRLQPGVYFMNIYVENEIKKLKFVVN